MATDGIIQIGNISFRKTDVDLDNVGKLVPCGGNDKDKAIFVVPLKSGQVITFEDIKQPDGASIFIDKDNAINIDNARLSSVKGTDKVDVFELYNSIVDEMDIKGDPQNSDRVGAMKSTVKKLNHDERDILMFDGCLPLDN